MTDQAVIEAEQRRKPESSAVDWDQLEERLRWTPAQRLRYLLDMLDFERLARSARRVD